MSTKKIEFYVGIFVIIGIICVGYLFIVLGNFNYHARHYSIYAYFTSVSGLKEGARIEMAGVEIGTTAQITLDEEKLLAKVELEIFKSIALSEDIIASVKTSGIIGEKYIDISPGGSSVLLEPGDEIYNTESSLDIESLVRKFIFNKKAE